MDNTTTQDTVPQLSQEKILQIMNMVKNKELSIEGALDLAQKETRAEKEAMSLAFLVDSQDLLTGSQFNFSVYKYKRYRWQKRILQIDFNTEAIFNIEKGIIKKQFPFSQIKSCEDSEERRFSITFHGRPDYELEAISLEDKRKVHLTLGLGSTEMGHKAVNKAALSGVWNETPNQSNVTCSLIECWEISHLVNKVIQSNSYRKPAESSSGRPAKCDVIHEGLLDFQQNSFASIKWVKCLVQLREGELSLYCIGQCGENKNADPVAKIVNLSDGNVSVIKENGCETFSVQTKEHNYLFRIPFTVQTNRAEDVSKLRNEWVSLIDRYCRLWKNRSAPQEGFGESISGSEYETFHISQNKQTEEAHCLAVCSEAAVLSLPLAPCSTPATGQAAPASSSLQPRRVQAGVPPPPFFPPPFRLPPALKRTKAFHWDVVPQEKIQKSIWASCSLRTKKIDESRIYAQFHIQDMAVFSVNETSVNQHIMLNQKIAHNFNIFLKSFHIKPNQLKEKLYILHEDAGGFTDEQITSLRRYLPTPNDIEMYQSFKGLPSELHVVDQFMLEMCKIPHLGQRLDLLLAIRELPMCMGDLEPLINQKIRACKQLQASQKFVAVLEYILAIGNYLNEKAGREKAKGFRLSSLTKLSLLRGTEKKITLLHALLEQIFLHEPDLAKFSQELTEFEAIPGASIKGLRAEVDVLKKELENVIQYRRVIKSKTIKATTQESQFYKELKDVIQKYEGHLSQLSKRCDEMKKLYNDTLKTECLKMEIFGSKQEYLNLDVLLKCLMQDVLCLSRVPIFLYAPGSPMMNHVKQLLGCAAGGEKMVKFGEQPDQDSQELFGWISAFIREFRKVSADIKS